MAEFKQFHVGSVNADHTSRHRDLTSRQRIIAADRLADGLMSRFATLEFARTRLFSVTEFNATAASKVFNRLDSTFDWFGSRFGSGDYTAFYWDQENGWSPQAHEGVIQIEWSDVGKFGGVVLEHETSKERVLYLTAHMPHKSRRQVDAGFNALVSCVEEHLSGARGEAVNAVIVAGDFNAAPSVLQNHFSPADFRLALESDGVLTTASNACDNVIVSDDLEFNHVGVDTSYTKFTHFPIYAQLSLTN